MAIIELPASMLDNIRQVMDDVFDIQARTCTLYYPPKQVPCTHVIESIGDKTTNIWIGGSPSPPYAGQICHMCNGSNFISEEVTDTIRLVIYWNPSQYSKDFPPGLRVPTNVVKTRGLLVDLNKVLNCTSIELASEVGATHFRYKLIGEPTLPERLVKNRFFHTWWERI